MALPKFEDYKAPWETDLKEGETPEIDADKLKKYLHGLLSDKEKLQERVVERDTTISTLQGKVDEKTREGESEADRLKRERDEALEKANKKSESDLENLKLRIAIRKGLTEKQLKRLQGSTEEELEADADELLETFGGAKSGEQEQEEQEESPRGTPARRLRNPGDPNGGEPKLDVDAAADAYVSGRGGF